MAPSRLESEFIEWSFDLFGSQPVWKIEPSIDAIAKVMHSEIPNGSKSRRGDNEPQLFAEGAFNKLYIMNHDEIPYILRVSLPVDPYYKVASEVATLSLIRSSTSLIVPEVIAHHAESPEKRIEGGCGVDNPLGLEWILMKKLPGQALAEVWDNISIDSKISLVESIADSLHELYVCEAARSSLIGNIYQESPHPTGQSSNLISYETGRIVSMPFFWNQRLSQSVHRGPFSSSAEWLTARLLLVINECNILIDNFCENMGDIDEKYDAKKSKSIAQRLQKCLPGFCSDQQETFCLHHDDISLHNILINSTGGLAGIVDWECVSIVPAWKSCQVPFFLTNTAPPRASKPRAEDYLEYDGSLNDLYFTHIKEWEITILRKRFLEYMETKDSDWIRVYESSRRIRDFEYAVQHCDNEMMIERIIAWLYMVENKQQYWSLQMM
ncbi:hypothetical protein TWF102_008084 [Orbilia oligospora]|uniref:Aminoglycoside phosphotransferase domain-containing protein n=1 Tax=Orbilia oligospora TaxID=2813651 RepID=A0A7C8JG72_ORBOL|nr:hypothetical protein TWF103_011404 [Orbilia oligospora]KAF3110507.1 hypothetical protein TWF102_008084 [Orbilia oligospora]